VTLDDIGFLEEIYGKLVSPNPPAAAVPDAASAAS
jgi:hypothetical protein